MRAPKLGLDEQNGLRPWVIFDADNTLWHVETLYDEARREFVELLGRHGVDRHLADLEQRRRDAELYRRYGYSPARFESSFIATARHLLPSLADALEPQVRALARAVFSAPARADRDVEEVLDRLTGCYGLGIVTAGERVIQRARLDGFPFVERFDAIEVVERKSAAVFDAFCREHAVARALSYVVGDSLKSDVLPARAAGLNAIWLDAPNWRDVERGRHKLPDGVPRVARLADILELIPALADIRPS